jgi:hypothetical protein
MSNQIVISSGAKVRDLDGVLTGTSGIVSSVPLGAANGVATLDSGGKVPVSQLPSSVVTYLGTWNAATNTPTLVNGTGDAGDMYICNVAGTVNFGAGPVTFAVGDWVLYGSGTWQKSNGQNGTVTSVAVTESGDALTITGSPITTAGTINIGFAGTSGQYVNGAGGLTTFPSLAGYVTSVTATAPLLSSGGTTPDLSIPAASASVDGYLDNADWTTFNNKQNAITLTTTGTSGVSTLIGSTLNIPNYSTDLSGYVPYTGATANVNLGTFDLTADVITGATGSFASSGGSNTFAINHSSGSGIALNITKGGNGEGLYINKTSGSGNAATIIGTLNATTLVKSGGTSSQFLKADGSVDSSAYITLTSLSAGTGITYNNTTGVITNSAPDQTVSLTQGAGISISGTYPSFTIASTITQYTDALARAALSFTAGSGAYNSTTGVITIPTNNNQITNGSNFITLTSLSAGAGINYNNTTGAISSTITQYTDALARAAISLTTTGTSGAATYNSTTGVFNIPQYTDQYVGTVTSVGLSSSTSGVTIGSSPITTSGTITLAIATASGSQNGLLSSTDWTTFNNKYNLPSLTSGSVLFSNGSTIAQDNANFFWDDTNNRLGIGTATPLYTLDVVKTGSNGIRVLNNDSGSEAAFVIVQNLTTAGLFGVNNAGPYLYTASALDMQFYTSAIERMRIFSDGNILIGNAATNAGYKLDVSGTGRFSKASSGDAMVILNATSGQYTQLYWNNANVTKGSIYWDNTLSEFNYYTIGTHKFAGAATFSSSIAATSATFSGNVFALNYYGTDNANLIAENTNTNGTVLTLNSKGTVGIIKLQTNSTDRLTIASTGAATFSSSVTASGDITSRTSLNAYTLSNVEPYVFLARNSGSNGIGVIRTLDGGALAFDNGATGAAQSTKMTLSASGNLGLGVTPSAWGSSWKALELSNGVYLTALSSSTVPIMILGANAYFDNTNFIYKTTAAATRYQQDSGVHYWYNAPSGTAGNAISFTQAMTLNASGSLGIGTTTMSSGIPLTINAASGLNTNIAIQQNSVNKWFVRNLDGTDDFSFFYAPSSGERLRITSGGNVLIGTTTDAGYKLDVNGTTRTLDFTIKNSANAETLDLFLSPSTSNGFIDYPSGRSLMLRNKGSLGGLTLASTGAATFSSSVDARGNITMQFDGTAANQAILSHNGTSAILYSSGNTTKKDFTIFRDGGVDAGLIIKGSTGNVLIGTTTGVSGGGALQVNGNVNINGVFQINGTTIGGGGGSGVTGSGTTGYIPKWSSASSIGNSLLYDSGGAVAIGNTANGAGMAIEFASNASVPRIDFVDTSEYTGQLKTSSKIVTLQNISNNPLVFGTNATERIRIFANGNVGINRITDAGYTFDVNGTGRFTGQLTGTDALFAGSVTASGGFFDTSDSRLKILVKDYEQPKGIENVVARMYVKNSKQELGYYAQDLQEILPSAVGEGSDGFLTLSYSQVHTAKIAYLEDKVAQLEELIKSLIK